MASPLRGALLLAVGLALGTLLTLEAVSSSGALRAHAAFGTYFRLRDVHVRAVRRDARHVSWGNHRYFEHVDEAVTGVTGGQCAAKPADEADAAKDVPEEPVVHFFDPSFGEESVPPPKVDPAETRYDEDGDEILEHVYISCEKNQTLFEETEQFLPRETFERMAKCLVGHPAIEGNPLSDSTFKGTTGFASKFGGERGIARFLAETRYNCGDYNPLVDFFNAARDPMSLGFVMNVLVAKKPKKGARGIVVKKHVDNTLAHEVPASEYLPRTVSVLYLNVPADMKGGQLEILTEDDDEEEKVLGSVTPLMNKMARFRGDAYHRVRGYETKSEEQRISLVLEQYRVLPQHVGKLTEYETSVKDGVTMM